MLLEILDGRVPRRALRMLKGIVGALWLGSCESDIMLAERGDVGAYGAYGDSQSIGGDAMLQVRRESNLGGIFSNIRLIRDESLIEELSE